MAALNIAKGQADLVDYIDWRFVECLNENHHHNNANALKKGYREDDGLFLESDVDEQLLLHIPFSLVVKIHSIIIKGPDDEGPKLIKLYANKESMGFSNVSDFTPSDVITLSQEQLAEGKFVQLKYVKFQAVRSLSLFVESNHGDSDKTRIQKIVLLGSTVETTNMNDLKKVEEH